jgi:hypothetical protein
MRDYAEWKKPEKYETPEWDVEFLQDSVRDHEILHWDSWTENVDANFTKVKSESDWIRSEYGKHEGPVIVCGAGPSLSRNSEWLKAQYDDGVPVIVVDRAFREVKRLGIKPLFVVSDDDQEIVQKFYCDFEESDTAVLSLTTHPEVHKRRTSVGTTKWFGSMIPISAFWNMAATHYGSDEMQQVRCGAVVGYSAVDIAIWCGFEPIITLGNELSFKDKYEAFKYFNGATTKDTMLMTLEGQNKDKLTIPAFYAAAQCFNRLLDQNPEVTLLDASDGIINWPKIQPMGLVRKELHNGGSDN